MSQHPAISPSPQFQKLMDPITRGSSSELPQLLDSLKLDAKSEKSLISQCFLGAVRNSSIARWDDTKEILNILYSKGANVNFCDFDGKTSLMYAAEKGYIELVSMLLEWRPDVDQMDNFQRTALYFAIDSKECAENEDIVSILAEETSDKTVNLLTSEQKTCLSRAVENNFAKITRNLLAHFADPNIFVRSAESPAKETPMLETPLFIAVRNKNFAIVEALIEFGADVGAKNKENCSVFEIADAEMCEKIKEFVAKHHKNEEKSLAGLENLEKTKASLKGKASQSLVKGFEFFEDKETEVEKSRENATNVSENKNFYNNNGNNFNNISNNGNNFNNNGNNFTAARNSNNNNYNSGMNKSASGKGFTSNNNKQINKNFGSVENLNPDADSNITNNAGFFQKKTSNNNNMSNISNTNVNAYNFSPPQLLAQKPPQFLVPNTNSQENLEPSMKTSNYPNRKPKNFNMASANIDQISIKPQENNIMSQLGVPGMMNAIGATAENLNKNLNFPSQAATPNKNATTTNPKFPINPTSTPTTATAKPQFFLYNNGNFPNNINNMSTNNFTHNNNFNNNLNNNAIPINNNIGGIRTSHYDSTTNKKTVSITLNLNDTSSIEYLKNHADKLYYEHREKKLLEEHAEQTKKIELQEKKLQDLAASLRKVTEEKDKIQKDYEKLKKNTEIHRNFHEQGVNTDGNSPCKIDFLDFLNVSDLSQHPKVKRLYQNFISNSTQIEARLHEEIVEFQRNVEQFNQDNSLLFQKLIKLVTDAVISAIPDATVQTYGSFATELCLPHSDIDLVIESKYMYQYPNADYRAIVLGTIEEVLKKASFVSETKNIPAATVPVLKVICTEEFLKKRLDITVKDGNHNGLNCVLLVRKYIKSYAPLKPLVLVLKYMLYHLDLADTYQGGLNSYGLILMIVSMLQSFLLHDENILSKLNLGGLLISFFHLYGWELDYCLYQINPSEPESNNKPLFVLRDENKFFQPFQPQINFYHEKLVIVDPNNPTNNVGRCTKNINLIKKAFFIACIALHENVCVEKEHVHFNKETTLKNDRSCCILKKIFFLPYTFLKSPSIMMESTG